MTLATAPRLMPQNFDDWPAMIRMTNDRPPDGDPLDPQVKAAYKRYVALLGPFTTPDLQATFRAIDDAHFENDYSLVGPQRCVISDGQPHAGKTYAALMKAFVETRDVWDANPASQHQGASRIVPWAYVEIPPRAQAASLLRAILTFIAHPGAAHRGIERDNATRLGSQIRDIAPQIGLRGVIIDDSHGLAGTDPRLIGDILKTTVTGIPATTVILGAGLRERGVFDSLPGRQVCERANWVNVGGWPPPPKTGPLGPWGDLLAQFAQADLFPDPDKHIALDHRADITWLVNEAGQQPGTVIKWLKRAATRAIDQHTHLDRAALEATRPPR